MGIYSNGTTIYDYANNTTGAEIHKINYQEKFTCLLVIFTFDAKMFFVCLTILE